MPNPPFDPIGQIDQELHATMTAMAEALSEVFKGYGFALLVFDMNTTAGRMNYISNAERASMVVAFKEFVARTEARAFDPPEGFH